MIINAIRFHPQNGKEVYLRFIKGKLEQTLSGNFVSYFAPKEDLEQFAKALCFIITNTPQGGFKNASVNLIDNDGHSWVIDRAASGEAKVYRNRKAVKDGLSLGQLYTLLDMDANTQNEPLKPQHILNPLTLKEKEGDIYATQNLKMIGKDVPEKKDPNLIHMLEIISLIKDIQPSLGGLSPQRLIKVLERLSKSYHDYQSLKKGNKALLKSTQSQRAASGEYLTDLKEQIKIIKEIEKIGQEALLPQNSLTSLKKNYLQLDKKLEHLCADFGLEGLPTAEKPIPWEKTLNILSRLKLYEYLQEAFDMASKKSKTVLEPVLNSYAETIEMFLKNDTKMTLELESCLHILTKQLSHEKQGASDTPSIYSKLKGFFAKKEGEKEKEKEKQKEDNDPLVKKENALETGRMAIDIALTRLGELHANLSKNKSAHKGALDQIETRHEKIIAEYGKLKQTWKKHASTYNLPENCDVRRVLKLIQNHAALSQLYSEKEKAKQKINSQKQRLSNLESLIQSYRVSTKSIKESSLKDPANLLLEVRSILGYSAKKDNQIRKIEGLMLEEATEKNLRKIFLARESALKKTWLEIFEKENLPPIEITDPLWPKMIDYIAPLTYLSKLVKEDRKALRGNDIFSAAFSEMPITLFHWETRDASDAACQKLDDYLANASRAGLGIFLVSDKKINAYLAKMGVAPARAVPKKEETKPKIKAPPKSILSERAQNALKVFSISHETDKQ